MVAVVGDVRGVDRVFGDSFQRPERSAAQDVLHCPGRVDDDGSVVEEHVMVWAEAQDVVEGVGSVVWPAQPADVSRLGVGASRRDESGSADLAGVVVEFFDL